MCDYSLELIRSRPAKAGDKLASTSFPNTPTRGFAAADDRSVAVCLLPGTELSFEKEIRCEGVNLLLDARTQDGEVPTGQQGQTARSS